MSTKRRTLDRPRRVTCSPETVALFRELDGIPKRARDNVEFKAKERTLMRALGLGDEWFFSQCSVLDRAAGPCRLPDAPASIDWFRCREVRNALLGHGEEHGLVPALPAHPTESV
jgi:hypothetical protein